MEDGYYRVYLLVKYNHMLYGNTLKQRVYACTIAIVDECYVQDSAEYNPRYSDMYDVCMLEMLHVMMRAASRYAAVEAICNVLGSGLHISHPDLQRFNQNIYPSHILQNPVIDKVARNIINYPDISVWKNDKGEWVKGDWQSYRVTLTKCPCGRHRDEHRLAKTICDADKLMVRTVVPPLFRMIPDSNVVKHITQYLLLNIKYRS